MKDPDADKAITNIPSSSGWGGIKASGFRKPQPDRFKRKDQSEPPKVPGKLRELADRMRIEGES